MQHKPLREILCLVCVMSSVICKRFAFSPSLKVDGAVVHLGYGPECLCCLLDDRYRALCELSITKQFAINSCVCFYHGICSVLALINTSGSRRNFGAICSMIKMKEGETYFSEITVGNESEPISLGKITGTKGTMVTVV